VNILIPLVISRDVHGLMPYERGGAQRTQTSSLVDAHADSLTPT
jgi:hypothetical protein